MKIAIPVEDKHLDSTVCVSFGRTPYFLIYNTEDEVHSFLDNSAAASQGGAGIKAAQAVVDQAVNALLTPRCGENASEVLVEAGVTIYKTNGTSIKENIELFKQNGLSALTEVHAGLHQHR
ncbi:NifB/NifX family molybdenum-iron cluster-binding protein [Fusibacter sp. 3D3]|uniref:NifB/NifX family molybdenum-iron cluster-binding protein n=1 Tax=Fusibacter sp. 3D3 TaxID=1048380 RepID=UPI0008539D7A|nr:NifB/NifX family molybdenum-iron cluster-binding protein [Fusibacter sp. 3D3]GAU76506.1 glycine-rich cell wall structural protein precursor [Fusibacter sp. 3D3]